MTPTRYHCGSGRQAHRPGEHDYRDSVSSVRKGPYTNSVFLSRAFLPSLWHQLGAPFHPAGTRWECTTRHTSTNLDRGQAKQNTTAVSETCERTERLGRSS